MTRVKVATEHIELMPVDELTPHPMNYREHPPDQLAHLVASIEEHGIYRNIVIARDNTILAGHGVVLAAKAMSMTHVPVHRIDIEATDPRALKVLAGDNEISRLAEIDDRRLSEILKDIKDADSLAGTGYDEMMLANLVMVTRPQSEIADFDAAAEWVGVPAYEAGSLPLQVVVSFRTEEDRIAFGTLIGAELSNAVRAAALWWPARERDDLKSVKFEG